MPLLGLDIFMCLTCKRKTFYFFICTTVPWYKFSSYLYSIHLFLHPITYFRVRFDKKYLLWKPESSKLYNSLKMWEIKSKIDLSDMHFKKWKKTNIDLIIFLHNGLLKLWSVKNGLFYPYFGCNIFSKL